MHPLAMITQSPSTLDLTMAKTQTSVSAEQSLVALLAGP